ncbi:MAG: hypothetical protein KDH20_07555 [Rhodocyclaceae bacterium]|nr:hypothetical protein [Rhodocyclaceae bacterium]
MGVRNPRPNPFPLHRLIAYVLVAAFALGALVGRQASPPAPEAAAPTHPATA